MRENNSGPIKPKETLKFELCHPRCV